MKLSELLHELPFSYNLITCNPEIAGIVSDSRLVKPGYLFVALTGGSTDGHLYIPAAIERGAVAVVSMIPVQDLKIPNLQVEDSRMALPHLAAAFYGYPGRKLTVIGVTGTDGKTTTTNLIYAILQAAGYKSGMISTINAVIGDEVLDTGFHVTTPDAPDVQRYLSNMVSAGLTHVVLEVTSHGLAQYRADACEFDP
jgi:UDP-N-acetylmuramoyl-L-alanyl-D-glutamate--2,6-diaminopimelate ligase